MPTDQLITAVITATITLIFTVVLPRVMDLITGAQGRKRDELKEAWDELQAAREATGKADEARRDALWAAHALRLDLADCHAALLRAGLPLPPIRHSLPPPFTPPTPTFDPRSLIEPPVRGHIDNP